MKSGIADGYLRMARSLWDNASMFVVLIVLFVVLSFTIDRFFSVANMVNLMLSVSMVGMVACTMLFCLASGDFDLSVEAIVACSGVVAAVVLKATESVTLAIAGGVLAGGLVGVVNGFVIAKLKINALITTLATMQIVLGLGYIISEGKAISVQVDRFSVLGVSSMLGVPTPVWIMIACFAVFGLLLHNTVFGRNALAIGGNREAARLSGIAVDRTKIIIFTVQGLIAGFAGVVSASMLGVGEPNPSPGFSLSVISACVLGGVSLSGGIGTILGVIAGVLIMGSVQNAMTLRNVDFDVQYLVRGGILLAAVLLDRFKRRGA